MSPAAAQNADDFVATYRGLNVTVMGLGTFGGGLAAAQFLLEHQAHVTVTDQRSETDMAQPLADLKKIGSFRLFAGGHPQEAFADCELLVVNPAVRPDHAAVQECRSRGVPVTTEIGLLLQHIDAQVIAVTGSNGKSTTATLIRDFLQPAAEPAGRQVWLGGNLGGSLLPVVDRIQASDRVVLEISSFQLHTLRDQAFAPDIAVLTNFTPNHLDWHDNVESYHAAKQVVFARQQRHQHAILPQQSAVAGFEPLLSDDVSWRIRGQCLRFGLRDEGEDGAFFENGDLILRRRTAEDAIRLTLPPQLPGDHNARNICAAACAAWVAGGDPETFQHALTNFETLPHRLEFIVAGRGLRFVDDSNSTTPESTIAALRSCRCPVVLLAGGSDKGANLKELCEVIHEKAVAAVLMGATAENLARELQRLRVYDGAKTVIAADFPSAFAQAVELAPQGSIVLLSPGFASFGWFRDYRDRGEQFRRLAREWVQ